MGCGVFHEAGWAGEGFPGTPESAAREPIISWVPMKAVRIVLVAFSCVGISLFFAAALVYEQTAKFVGRSRTATGTVMELSQERSISREGPSPMTPTAFVQGKEIHVQVDLANPKRYLMDTFFLPENVVSVRQKERS